MPNVPNDQEKLGPYVRVPVKDLLLDPENPRLIEYGIEPGAPQDELLQILWEEFAIKELAMSIAYSGYFTHEPLFAEVDKSGRNIVIEGNRRLAAVKLLLSKELQSKVGATDLPNIDTIDPNRRSEISELPVIKTNRHDIWRYLGFKHVNGPSSWGSYAKAQYIAQVHNDFKVPLNAIATQIGDYSNTVAKMYRGLMVIEQAESENVFSRKNVATRRFFFNYIYTAITLTGVRAFLGLDKSGPESRHPVPKDKITELGQLCTWLYGDATRGIHSLIKSQNPDLGILDDILRDASAVNALRDGYSLDVAKAIQEGDDRIFRRSVQDARLSLQRAHSTLSTGFQSGDSEILIAAIDVEELAADLVSSMRSKNAQARKRIEVEAETDE